LLEGTHVANRKIAAQAIATGVGRELHEVDLSAVAKKYIGQTEKKLSQLFDAAERNDWVLFFDEADALFGKRTQVKDSHDRYANVAADYLLQRLHTYRGLAILGTNSKTSLDPALGRLFGHVISIPSPGTNCD
jgi:SpoVK/Ycf46/Vps4 family AAA+-type ATPase